MNIGLTILAYGMVIVFLALIMTKKISPMTGLALVPIIFAAIGIIFNLFVESYSPVGRDDFRRNKVNVSNSGYAGICHFIFLVNDGCWLV